MAWETSKFQVSLPDDFLPLLNQRNANVSLDEQVKVTLAVGLFLEKKVTLARAAELAGKSLSDFIDYLGDRGIAWMEYTEEDRRLDDQAIAKFLAEEGEKDD
jgi:predicted HTH domain antitoxin